MYFSGFLGRKALNHELSEVFSEMCDVDVNHLMSGKDYTIDLQDCLPRDSDNQPHKQIKVFPLEVQSSSSADCPFTSLEGSFHNTCLEVTSFVSLLENCETPTGIAEVVTPEETVENNCFLDAILATEVMKVPFLSDSFCFEHAFVGETQHGKQILGLHDWVQSYLQEKHSQIDHQGYVAQKNKTRYPPESFFTGLLSLSSSSSLY
ncbi:poly(U)-specific endoribonuclease-B-like [Patagioenas fasciata]|uniref:poly(U)-specific endoribonuclease-B-like n=1 Tax=Patagioenas fasciata TaxID=372321 RepID=UPI003A99F9D0